MSINNHANRSVSKKLIKKWEWDVKVGIYENCTHSVRVYEDRTLHREPGVKWIGNTGGYHESNNRYTGSLHENLLLIAQEELEDDCDYTDRVAELLSNRYRY